MLVHNGDDLLLARGRLFPVPMYSALAGFVEPGESIEEAVRREVAEEVGVAIGRLDYFGSQPWPFPNSLMLGFFAEYAGGDIVIDESEIVDANWYRHDQLPNVPGEISIASKLIRAYCESRR
jgi:NAD+ diphosphatase